MRKNGLYFIIQRLNIDIMDKSADINRELVILEKIELNPDETQASLAAQIGVAVGTINWHLKRLIDKGYVKVRRAERRKLRYIITPEGLALRAKLTLDYIQNQFSLYRLVRLRSLEMLGALEKRGVDRIRLVGEGDVYDVCKLTCVEQGIEVTDDKTALRVEIIGLKLFIDGQPHDHK